MWIDQIRVVCAAALAIGCPLFAYLCSFFHFASVWKQWSSNAGAFLLMALWLCCALVSVVQFVVLSYHVTSAPHSLRSILPQRMRTTVCILASLFLSAIALTTISVASQTPFFEWQNGTADAYIATLFIFLFSFTLLSSVLLLVLLLPQYERFHNEVRRQRFLMHVDLVYDDTDAACRQTAESLASSSLFEPYLVSLIPLENYLPNTMLENCRLLLLVVNDNENYSHVALFQWLLEEADMRVYEGLRLGWSLNIVYTQEGFRRTSFNRVKYAVLYTGEEKNLRPDIAPVIQAAEIDLRAPSFALDLVLEDFGCHRLCARSSVGQLRGWKELMATQLATKTIHPEAEPLLGSSSRSQQRNTGWRLSSLFDGFGGFGGDSAPSHPEYELVSMGTQPAENPQMEYDTDTLLAEPLLGWSHFYFWIVACDCTECGARKEICKTRVRPHPVKVTSWNLFCWTVTSPRLALACYYRRYVGGLLNFLRMFYLPCSELAPPLNIVLGVLSTLAVAAFLFLMSRFLDLGSISWLASSLALGLILIASYNQNHPPDEEEQDATAAAASVSELDPYSPAGPRSSSSLVRQSAQYRSNRRPSRRRSRSDIRSTSRSSERNAGDNADSQSRSSTERSRSAERRRRRRSGSPRPLRQVSLLKMPRRHSFSSLPPSTSSLASRRLSTSTSSSSVSVSSTRPPDSSGSSPASPILSTSSNPIPPILMNAPSNSISSSEDSHPSAIPPIWITAPSNSVSSSDGSHPSAVQLQTALNKPLHSGTAASLPLDSSDASVDSDTAAAAVTARRGTRLSSTSSIRRTLISSSCSASTPESHREMSSSSDDVHVDEEGDPSSTTAACDQERQLSRTIAAIDEERTSRPGTAPALPPVDAANQSDPSPITVYQSAWLPLLGAEWLDEESVLERMRSHACAACDLLEPEAFTAMLPPPLWQVNPSLHVVHSHYTPPCLRYSHNCVLREMESEPLLWLQHPATHLPTAHLLTLPEVIDHPHADEEWPVEHREASLHPDRSSVFDEPKILPPLTAPLQLNSGVLEEVSDQEWEEAEAEAEEEEEEEEAKKKKKKKKTHDVLPISESESTYSKEEEEEKEEEDDAPPPAAATVTNSTRSTHLTAESAQFSVRFARMLSSLRAGEEIPPAFWQTLSPRLREQLALAEVFVPPSFVETQTEFWSREQRRIRSELMNQGFSIIPKGLLNPFQLEAIRRTYREAFHRFGGFEAARNRETNLFSWNDEPVARSLNHLLTRWASELLQVDLLHPGLALVLWNMPGNGFLLHTGWLVGWLVGWRALLRLFFSISFSSSLLVVLFSSLCDL